MSAPAVELEGVRFAYPRGGFALAVERLRVERGERVACVGPSGSGKTTLLELIAGIRTPDAGRVRVGGVDVHALDEDRRRALRLARVGLVFQELELIPYLNAFENVLLPYRLGAGTLDANVRERALFLMQEAGIARAATQPPARLSQGERQRVAVCRALCTEPDVLLCDEATGNLDADAAARTIDLYQELCERRGSALVLVTHDTTLLGRFQRVVDVRALAGGPG